MQLIHLVISSVVSFLIAFSAIYLLINARSLHIAVDQPNHRSLHTQIVPRTGGIGLMTGIFAIAIYVQVNGLWWTLVFTLLVVSLIDDIRGLPFYWRFLSHFLAAAIFVLSCLALSNLALAILLILVIVWVTNLYNFMDGSDGLAGGMAVFGFSAYALAAYLSNNMMLASVNASIASASLAFLLFNFNPAKIFMGDSGSIPLGFLAASVAMYGYQQSVWPAWFPLVVFSPFIVDATITLFKRLLRGEKVWQAHRSHYYQRLVQMGWGHKKTAIAEYCLMALMAASALVAWQYPMWRYSLLIAWIIVYTIVLVSVDRKWRLFSVK